MSLVAAWQREILELCRQRALLYEDLANIESRISALHHKIESAQEEQVDRQPAVSA